jgi:hypothetical protein
MRRFDRLSSSFAVRGLSAACAVALVVVTGSVANGCYSGTTGSAPDDAAFYYPVGLALSGAFAHTGSSDTRTRSDYLFVANSDFDLAFNAGTLAAVDLDAVEYHAHLAEAAGASCTDPGCFPEIGVGANNYITGSVRIGAFAADVIVTELYQPTIGNTPGPAVAPKQGRIFIPVRGDGAITYIDYAETDGGLTLDCGGQTATSTFGQACGDDHHVGNDSTKDSRQIVMDGQPFAMSAVTGGPSDTGSGGVGGDARINEAPPAALPTDPTGSLPLGGVLVTADQSTGDVSLFVDALVSGVAPTLAYSLTGLPTFATAVTPIDFLPPTGGDANYTSRFLVTNRSVATISVVDLLADQSDIQRSALTTSGSIPITTNAGGSDTRAVAVDPPSPAETAPGATPRPTRIFLSSRAPASLVTGEIDPTSGNVSFFANIALPVGPSRLTRTSYVAADGTTHTRLFLTSYDAREIVAYDPDTGRIGNVIHTGRGPYAFAYDGPRKLAYVANFIDNTVQVIELDDVNHSATFEQIIFTIGIAKGPQR